MRMVRFLAAALLAVAALQTSTSFAQSPPTRFWGIVTINGEIAPPGTEVRGFVQGNECGFTTSIEDGLYVLDVADENTVPGCGYLDVEVTFTVNGIAAAETSFFTPGAFREVNLSITTDGAPPPPPGETPPSDPPPEEPPPSDPPPSDPPPEEPPSDPPPEEPEE